MSVNVDDLFAKAAVLSADERATLAGLLIESLDSGPADAGAEEAWATEVERRMADYRAGRVRTIGWTELRERLHRER
jgi:putative addiction module component (TIGR02574 family)